MARPDAAGPARRSTLEQRRSDYLRLLRQAPAITEVSYLDAAGREQLRISRLAMNVVGSGVDFSQRPEVPASPKPGKTYFSPVYFRNESEPYMTHRHRRAAAATAGVDRRRGEPEVHLGRGLADQDRPGRLRVRRRRATAG